MFIKSLTLLIVSMFILSCAAVPKESVELSATVGRDIAEVHKSHRALAEILFARMRHDINRFIDEVYAPFQIRTVMERQHQLAKSPDPEDNKKSLLLAISAAMKPGAPDQLQAAVLKGMGIMVEKIRNDVESMRTELLGPLDEQEREVLGSIDRAYQQLHYANSIVTGHLSSVARVHDTQAELLREIGIERDLRKQVGENLAKASDKIAGIAEDAEKTDATLDKVEKSAEKIKETIEELKGKLNDK